jgi:hypothetical protein
MADAGDRQNVVRVHITQDDFGYWMMSLERADGTLTLASYRFEHAEHEIHHAYHPQEIGLPVAAEFFISEPAVPLRAGAPGWRKPQPRRAREPYYIVKNGLRVN